MDWNFEVLGIIQHPWASGVPDDSESMGLLDNRRAFGLYLNAKMNNHGRPATIALGFFARLMRRVGRVSSSNHVDLKTFGSMPAAFGRLRRSTQVPHTPLSSRRPNWAMNGPKIDSCGTKYNHHPTFSEKERVLCNAGTREVGLPPPTGVGCSIMYVCTHGLALVPRLSWHKLQSVSANLRSPDIGVDKYLICKSLMDRMGAFLSNRALRLPGESSSITTTAHVLLVEYLFSTLRLCNHVLVYTVILISLPRLTDPQDQSEFGWLILNYESCCIVAALKTTLVGCPSALASVRTTANATDELGMRAPCKSELPKQDAQRTRRGRYLLSLSGDGYMMNRNRKEVVGLRFGFGFGFGFGLVDRMWETAPSEREAGWLMPVPKKCPFKGEIRPGIMDVHARILMRESVGVDIWIEVASVPCGRWGGVWAWRVRVVAGWMDGLVRLHRPKPGIREFVCESVWTAESESEIKKDSCWHASLDSTLPVHGLANV
ncbi:hypothetical protein K438DRAFT_1932199 [Mycena galopus ATCC 62051]|nr:hypothetical protein K438DRAFT_1932199 [Mycena galopus ATCC 62051]